MAVAAEEEEVAPSGAACRPAVICAERDVNFVAGAALMGLRRTGQSSRHDAFFMAETLRAELLHRRAACMHEGDPNDPRQQDVMGVYIRQYTSLVPLDHPQQPKRQRPLLGLPTSLYKATSESDGETYALRRLEGQPLMEDALARARVWVAMAHRTSSVWSRSLLRTTRGNRAPMWSKHSIREPTVHSPSTPVPSADSPFPALPTFKCSSPSRRLLDV